MADQWLCVCNTAECTASRRDAVESQIIGHFCHECLKSFNDAWMSSSHVGCFSDIDSKIIEFRIILRSFRSLCREAKLPVSLSDGFERKAAIVEERVARRLCVGVRLKNWPDVHSINDAIGG